MPETVDLVVLPAPEDDRELSDFSDPLMLIEEAHHLTEHALDEAEATRRRPRLSAPLMVAPHRGVGVSERRAAGSRGAGERGHPARRRSRREGKS